MFAENSLRSQTYQLEELPVEFVPVIRVGRRARFHSPRWNLILIDARSSESDDHFRDNIALEQRTNYLVMRCFYVWTQQSFGDSEVIIRWRLLANNINPGSCG